MKRTLVDKLSRDLGSKKIRQKIRVMKCEVAALENRFDPSYDYLASMGYRDLALHIEVVWIIQKGMISIQKVCDW
jgi:hypothetical protein